MRTWEELKVDASDRPDSISLYVYAYCLSVYLWLCGMKVTSGHSLIDRDNNSDLLIQCQHHMDELVQFYCDSCDVCVCVLCTYVGQPHSGDSHNVLSFSDALTAHQTPFRALLADCTQRLNHVRTRYNAVLSHDQLIRKVSILYKPACICSSQYRQSQL